MAEPWVASRVAFPLQPEDDLHDEFGQTESPPFCPVNCFCTGFLQFYRSPERNIALHGHGRTVIPH